MVSLQRILTLTETTMNHRLLTYAFAITAATSSFAQHTHVMDVNTKKAGATVQNTMYGLFFEDINYAADGGLYGELVLSLIHI